TNLASRMKNAASEGPIINGATMHKASKAGPDLLPSPIDVISEEAADRAKLRPDSFVVELRGVQARHERGRAQLVARKIDEHTCPARQLFAFQECSGRQPQGRCEFPFSLQPDHMLPPRQLRGRSSSRIMDCRLSASRHSENVSRTCDERGCPSRYDYPGTTDR